MNCLETDFTFFLKGCSFKWCLLRHPASWAGSSLTWMQYILVSWRAGKFPTLPPHLLRLPVTQPCSPAQYSACVPPRSAKRMETPGRPILNLPRCFPQTHLKKSFRIGINLLLRLAPLCPLKGGTCWIMKLPDVKNVLYEFYFVHTPFDPTCAGAGATNAQQSFFLMRPVASLRLKRFKKSPRIGMDLSL